MAKPPSKPPAAKAAPKAPAKAPPKPAPKPVAKPKPIIPPITSKKIEGLASKALRTPEAMTDKQTQELGASVMRHIEPRKGGKP